MVKQGRGGRIIGASSLAGKLGQSTATYHNLMTYLTCCGYLRYSRDRGILR